MKHIILTATLLVWFSVNVCAQNQAQHLRIEAVAKKNYEHIKKGDTLMLHQLKLDKTMSTALFTSPKNQKQIIIPLDRAGKIVNLSPSRNDFWTVELFNRGVYRYYSTKGYQQAIRSMLIEDANEYTQSLNDTFYKDEYVTDYIRGLFLRITPKETNPNRPEQLKINLLNSANPDAYMLPNGTLLISTGLLSIIDTEEELKAIIACEVAHYALDHHVMNTAKERARVRRANAWGIALSLAGVASEVVLTTNNDHYVPGGIAFSAIAVSEILSEEAIRKMGMGYSDKQYFMADDVATDYLICHDIHPTALHSAISKIANFYKMENDEYALSKSGGYGNVDKRLARLPVPEKRVVSRKFQRTMAGVNTFNAIVQLQKEDFYLAERFAGKNIATGNASDEDYLVVVKARMSRFNTPEENQKCLELLNKAKRIRTNNLGIHKQEVLLLMRMGLNGKAKNALQEYMNLLEEFRSSSASTEDIKWANEEWNWSRLCYDRLPSI